MIRHEDGPIITREDIPLLDGTIRDVSSVFNPGCTTVGEQILLLLRVQTRGRETVLVPAWSCDGIQFQVSSNTLVIDGIDRIPDRVFHVYDPRITRLEDVNYLMFAMDTDRGCKLGLARTGDFVSAEFLGVVSGADVRNGVLFPQKIGGRYLRLDRPNRVQLSGGPKSGDTVWLSASDDLLHWEAVAPVFGGRPHYWDELVGAGTPPVRTSLGWLCLYHGVATHFAGVNIYQAGAVLLDLNDPSRVLGRTNENILEPRTPYEMSGQVPNVIFPSGWWVHAFDKDGVASMDSPVYVYYGAADTCVGLARTTIGDLCHVCT